MKKEVVQSAEVGHGLGGKTGKRLVFEMQQKFWIKREHGPSGDGGRQSRQRQRSQAEALRKADSGRFALRQNEHEYQWQHELKLEESEAEPAPGGKAALPPEGGERQNDERQQEQRILALENADH